MSCMKKSCTNNKMFRSNYDMEMLNNYNRRENFKYRMNDVVPQVSKYPPVPGLGTSGRYERTDTDLIMNDFWNNKKSCCTQVRNKEYYIGPRTDFDIELQKKWVKEDVPNCTYKVTNVENYGYKQSLEDPYNNLSFLVYNKM